MQHNLTAKNYFSPDAEWAYMGSSQFKRFMDCEAHAMAVLRGEWKDEPTTAMLVGSAVDACFSGTSAEFVEEHPEIFKKDGSLKADFEYANYIIARIKRDEMFMSALDGQKQVILVGIIAGVPFKIKIDVRKPERTVDMKIVKDFDRVYVEGVGYVSFIEAWGYDIQAAIYQEVERQDRGDFEDPLPFGIAGATKEKPEPDLKLIDIPQGQINEAMSTVVEFAPRFAAIKKGIIAPDRCGRCAYCRSTKILTQWEVLNGA